MELQQRHTSPWRLWKLFCRRLYWLLSVPVSIYFILDSPRIHPAYRMNFMKKYVLGFRMFLNIFRIQTGTSYKVHMVMALKLLEMSPDVQGDVLECGTWKGGAAANLSLVCKIVGRKLRIFDSFEGLPAGESNDREAKNYKKGDYCGTLDEVKENIRKYGELGNCEFIKGWFHDTLSRISTPIVLALLDVDIEASLHTCVKYLWPYLVEHGYIFTDESANTDYVALFYSEHWWQKYFQRTPPGLVGAGTGLPLGEYYIGPWVEEAQRIHPLQHASTGAYTQKSASGYWAYYPAGEEI